MISEKTMKEVTADRGLIASCGLYCGACKSYLSDRCAGCKGNVKAAWCKVRSCCQEKKIPSCADCKEYDDVSKCEKFNNIFSKLFGLLFSSDRRGCIRMIKSGGYECFANEMALRKAHTIKK